MCFRSRFLRRSAQETCSEQCTGGERTQTLEICRFGDGFSVQFLQVSPFSVFLPRFLIRRQSWGEPAHFAC